LQHDSITALRMHAGDLLPFILWMHPDIT